jgi:hypothetical protein
MQVTRLNLSGFFDRGRTIFLKKSTAAAQKWSEGEANRLNIRVVHGLHAEYASRSEREKTQINVSKRKFFFLFFLSQSDHFCIVQNCATSQPSSVPPLLRVSIEAKEMFRLAFLCALLGSAAAFVPGAGYLPKVSRARAG